MDEDDEFGDLYTDVLRPAAGTPPPPPILSAATSSGRNPPLDLNLHSDDEDILYGASDRNLTLPAHQTLTTGPGKIERQRISGGSGGGIANSIDESKAVQGDAVRVEKKVDVSGVLDTPNVELRTVEARVSEGLSSLQKSVFGDVDDEDGDKGGISMQKGGVFSREEMEDKLDIEVDVDDTESEPVIPGLLGGSFIPGVVYDGSSGADAKASVKDDGGGVGGDEWDSDSEDDLQIVLNDKSGPPGLHRNEEEGSEDDDEDGEDLVIVADGDQLLQPIEDQEWGDDSAQAADGERKEPGEPVKANGAMVGAVVARIGYSSHGYHPHHSQFKYVRPGAAGIPGGTLAGPAGATVQVRPPVNIGPIVGRGRGDWRPIGLKTAPNVQKNFHSGYGMSAWAANSSGRGFGGGLEFTLPSHKTVFDIDIDSFEEKPWRHPGVETSDFFNFGLDEEKWKYYCKQLEQLRLEATMQSKIRVYESGRSEQDYDPDLPPELAAATGIHDASVENAQFGKTDGGQSDPMGQGRGAARVRPPIPTGRAIQVEGGYGERLPSIDTRPPRIRDSDAIIEIVLQGSLDDDPMTANDAPEQPDCGLQGADVKRGGVEEDNEQNDNEYFDRLPQNYGGRKREMAGRRESVMGSIHDNVHEGDGILPVPPETLLQYPSGSKGRSMVYPGETPQNGRWPERAGRDKYPPLTAEHESEASPTQSFPENRVCDNQMEKSGESIGGKQTPQSSSLVSLEGARESSVEFKGDLHDELALDESSVAVEREEMTLNIGNPGETIRIGSPSHSSKKQKLSSRVEQTAVQDIGTGDDLRGTRSSDNSKVRSSSSGDYNKRRDGGEEEVVQEGHSKRMVDMKRHRDEDEHTFQRRDEYGRDGRHEMDRNHMVVKGREDSHHSHHYRDWDPSSAQASRAKTGDFERLRERDSSVGSRQRRDDDMHGRRVKEEDIRKRERVEEMGSRHRIKVREGERGEKDEYLHSRKWLDNGDWRSHHEKDVGSRQRERDDNFSSWHEKFDDSTSKRRKDEEHQRREQADREISQGYKAREDTGRRKRERDDSLDHRRREDQHRVRDKPDDSHSVRNRDDSWRQREREDRQRLKQPHEDMLSAREREGRGAVRSGRSVEDKSWVGNVRTKEEPKSLGSDKDYPFKDKRRQGEPPKRSDRKEDDSLSQHRGREDVYARENQFNIDRNLRHEKSSTRNDHGVNASDNQLGHKERHRESRKGKESEGGDHYTLGSSRRKQEDHSANRGEKGDTASKLASTNSRDPGQSRLSSSAVLSRKSHHEHEVQEHRSSRKHRDDAPSDDEQQDLRRGRSKLERWTSHKDRDDNTNSLLTSSKDKETGRNDNGRSSLVSEQVDKTSTMVESVNNQHPLGEDKNSHDAEDKDANTEPTSANKHGESDKAVDDRHLDTVAKLKKRSERFKTPMPSEKEAFANRKMDGETPVLAQTETAASTNAEIKPERPARKRRWISS